MKLSFISQVCTTATVLFSLAVQPAALSATLAQRSLAVEAISQSFTTTSQALGFIPDSSIEMVGSFTDDSWDATIFGEVSGGKFLEISVDEGSFGSSSDNELSWEGIINLDGENIGVFSGSGTSLSSLTTSFNSDSESVFWEGFWDFAKFGVGTVAIVGVQTLTTGGSGGSLGVPVAVASIGGITALGAGVAYGSQQSDEVSFNSDDTFFYEASVDGALVARATGTYSSDGFSGTYHQSVPEPLSILGIIVAAGVGAVMKRKP